MATGRSLKDVLKAKRKQGKKRTSWPKTIIFDKDRWTKKEAKAWLRSNGYYYGDKGYSAPDEYHRFAQYDLPSGYQELGHRFRYRKFGKGITGLFEFSGSPPRKRKHPGKGKK